MNIGKIFFYLPAIIFLTGCTHSTITVGSSFAPLAQDSRGIKYIKSDECREIKYGKFIMPWDEKAGFRVYQPENSPEKAVWRSLLPMADVHQYHMATSGVEGCENDYCHLKENGAEFYAGLFVDLCRNNGSAIAGCFK